MWRAFYASSGAEARNPFAWLRASSQLTFGQVLIRAMDMEKAPERACFFVVVPKPGIEPGHP
jgi:hypothetical protein